jgi:hypothetical protein
MPETPPVINAVLPLKSIWTPPVILLVLHTILGRVENGKC